MTVSPAGSAREAIEYCYSQGWTDGLPVVPCTEELLDEFLATTSRGGAEPLVHFRSVNRTCSVRDAAINAAMAGCLPSYFPVVMAAWEAVDRDGWASLGMLQSTSGSASMLVVNGPVRDRLEVNSGGNVFGSGFRANATIGRAMRLTAINVFGMVPHVLDQATQGQPARYSSCIAENEDSSPWAPLHTDFGFLPDQSTVTAFTIRSIGHVEARHTLDPEDLLRDIADSIARTGSLLHETVSSCVVLSPEHAHLLADAGLSKQAVREFLVCAAVVPHERLHSTGKSGLSRRSRFRIPAHHPDADPAARTDGSLAVLASVDAVHVIVAGAFNSGVSAVADLFGPGDHPPQPAEVRE